MLFFSPIVPMPLGNGAARRKFGAAERRAAEILIARATCSVFRATFRVLRAPPPVSAPRGRA